MVEEKWKKDMKYAKTADCGKQPFNRGQITAEDASALSRLKGIMEAQGISLQANTVDFAGSAGRVLEKVEDALDKGSGVSRNITDDSLSMAEDVNATLEAMNDTRFKEALQKIVAYAISPVGCDLADLRKQIDLAASACRSYDADFQSTICSALDSIVMGYIEARGGAVADYPYPKSAIIVIDKFLRYIDGTGPSGGVPAEKSIVDFVLSVS